MLHFIGNKIAKYGDSKKATKYVAALVGTSKPSDLPKKLRDHVRSFLSGRAINRDSEGRITWIEHTRGTNRGYRVSEMVDACRQTFPSANITAAVMFTSYWGD